LVFSNGLKCRNKYEIASMPYFCFPTGLLWSFESVIFVLSGSEENQKYNYSAQADQTGCLNLSLMSLREALPDRDRYSLEWVRLGNSQKLIEISTEVE